MIHESKVYVIHESTVYVIYEIRDKWMSYLIVYLLSVIVQLVLICI